MTGEEEHREAEEPFSAGSKAQTRKAPLIFRAVSLLAIIVLFVLCFAGGYFFPTSMKNKQFAAMELIGTTAPDVQMELLSGEQVKLSNHQNANTVILDFWASWCGPCIVSLPAVEEIAKEFADQGVVMYAVNEGEDASTIDGFIEKVKLDVPIVLDPNGEIGQTFSVTGLPQTVIIDSEGTIRFVHAGYALDTKSKLRQELRSLVNKAELQDETK